MLNVGIVRVIDGLTNLFASVGKIEYGPSPVLLRYNAVNQINIDQSLNCPAHCTFIEPLEKPADTGVKCPTCKQGDMVTRRSRRGKTFYSCSRYPDCEYAVWNEPVDKACPDCEWPM